MKKLTTIILLFFSLTAAAQEILSPLSSAPMPPAPKSTDTTVLELPFFDDFSNYTGFPSNKKWLTIDAFVNRDYAPFPPTVGIVTLDALDANGDLYPQATTSIFPADTLASQIIRLDSITGPSRRALQVSDSISLSFYFLPGGWYGNAWERVGDSPAPLDSLFLEFYDADADSWDVVWTTPGFDADTTGSSAHWPWRYVYIPIDSAKYLSRNFQFRFRNYASLDVNPKSGIAGNCDQWNIDYIYLNSNRSLGDSMIRDIAFVSKAPTMLLDYQAMPAKHYRADNMRSNLNLTITNRYNQTLASTYSYYVSDQDGNIIEHYNGGYENIGPFYPDGQYQTSPLHANPPVNFAFPLSSDETFFDIVHIVSEGVGGDLHTCNDTISFRQLFSNYFAYDDGVPENGYGITSEGSRQAIAYLFTLNHPDTLTTVNIFFNRTRNAENEDAVFQICVWSCHNGAPSNLIYKDAARMLPLFDGFNRYHRYILSEPLLVSDSVFIGFEQLSNKYINLGFDRSNDSHERIYYRTGTQWQQSFLSGSLMIRPAFGISALVSLPDEPQPLSIRLYPNPAAESLYLSLPDNGSTLHIEIIDMLGRTLISQPCIPILSLSNIPDGLYVVRIRDNSGSIILTQKIIIRK